jgi:dTMP kinase
MQRGTLICLTGIDGAGKSTLARSVSEALSERGYRATYTYGRYLPLLAYPVMELGRRTLLSGGQDEGDYTEHQSEKRELFAGSTLRLGYEALVMLDYAPQLLWRVAVPLYRYEYVVCDRYFYDTLLTDLCGDVVRTPEEAVSKYDRFYSRLVPDPDHEFYVEIDPEVSMERKDDVPAIEYLEERKAFYDRFAETFDLTRLDGTDAPGELVSSVLDAVDR